MAKESVLPLTKNSKTMKTNKTNSKMTTKVDGIAQKVNRTILKPKSRKGLVEKMGLKR